MTDAACQRCPEGRAPQSCTGPTSASRSTFRCGRAASARLLYFAASSLPLPRTSAATEGAGPLRRSQTGLYGQASTQLDSACPGVRYNETIIHQRGGQPGVARAAAARVRAWVSRSQFGNAPCSWNIDSTVCCQISSHKCISCSCRIDVNPSEAIIRNQRIQRQE